MQVTRVAHHPQVQGKNGQLQEHEAEMAEYVHDREPVYERVLPVLKIRSQADIPRWNSKSESNSLVTVSSAPMAIFADVMDSMCGYRDGA